MEGSRILIIVNNIELSSKIADILTVGKYYAEVTADGKKAVELIRNHPFDLIICGIPLNGIDGFAVLRTTNKFMETSGIGFIMLIAEAEANRTRKAMELGADGFIMHPFDDVELLNLVEVRLRKRRFQHEQFLRERLQLKRMSNISDIMGWLGSRLEKFPVKTYKKNQPLYHQGERQTGLHFVKHGRVKTFRSNETGQHIITAIYGAGAYFGIESLTLGYETLDSAEALEAVQVVTIPNGELQEMIMEYPDLLRIFVKDLSIAVNQLSERVVDIAHHSVRKRVANAILILSNAEEYRERSRKLSLSRNDLASFAGVAAETLSRVLSELTKEGFIKKDGNDIIIGHAEGLATIKN
ncbi:cyclic nucleotide-binding domain-containing protein [Pedobacter frigidisoli]|uniref:cyclic nucleotide-binding domain-containing protein n=1 Tax=Pedobacter frigidisoli TaxID=2530455 RepID=UPI00292E91E0|nr:cyclic nucleotide-binding domain-containing protein [Pedobacter frigidisoli]